MQTVSYYFGTKPRLMGEVITATVRGAMGDVAPTDRGIWTHSEATATEGGVLVDTFLDEVHPVLMSVAQLMDVARIGGLTDPEVQDVYAFHEDWRERDFAKLVEAIQWVDSLREGLDVRTAKDVVLTMLAADTYRMLSVDRGWDSEKLQEWMRATLKRLLLRDE